jgi:hypothetical protein
MRSEKTQWRSVLPALLLAVVGVGAIGFASVWPHRAASANQPLIVFAWDRDAVGVVVEAGGRIVSPGRVPGSIVAIADDPEILSRLYQSGALLVLRGDGAIGCETQI